MWGNMAAPGSIYDAIKKNHDFICGQIEIPENSNRIIAITKVGIVVQWVLRLALSIDLDISSVVISVLVEDDRCLFGKDSPDKIAVNSLSLIPLISLEVNVTNSISSSSGGSGISGISGGLGNLNDSFSCSMQTVIGSLFMSSKDV